MTADLEKLAGMLDEVVESMMCPIYDDDLRQAATALREVSALREALNAVMAEEMIYTGAITETLEASGMYPELVAKIRAARALATGEKP